MDKRAIAGMVSFLVLTSLLALAVPLSLEHARTNKPLADAVWHLLN
ncbi:MAG: hypothetical protein U5N10_08080 [Gemmobacter sp.]|nr:hypothetical protein [Gemmobacter sp.]